MRPTGSVGQLINVRGVVLWIVELVAQRGEAGDHDSAQAGIAGIRRNGGQAYRLVQIIVLIFLIDLEADAVEAQADLIQPARRKK